MGSVRRTKRQMVFSSVVILTLALLASFILLGVWQ